MNTVPSLVSVPFLLEFPTVEAMFNALECRELDGVLLDTFVAGASKDMLSSNVRVNKIVSYDSSYGIVFRGEMASGELQTCFNNFVSTKKGEISDLVDKNTTQVKVNSKIIITTFQDRNTRGDKSLQHVAATRRSNKFHRVNRRILSKILSPRQNFVAATCRTKSNSFNFVRHVAATKFCRGDKILIDLPSNVEAFTPGDLSLQPIAAMSAYDLSLDCTCTQSDVLQQRVAATCCSDLSPLVFRPSLCKIVHYHTEEFPESIQRNKLKTGVDSS